MIFPAKMFHVHSKGPLTETLCPDTDYSNGLELGGGGLDNAVDTGANLDDVNCDYLGTCYDGENKFYSFLILSYSSDGSPALVFRHH
jgi:hypothetical protein